MSEAITTTPPVETTAEKKERKVVLKLGCDPEFMMFYGNRKADAASMFQAFFKNTGLLAGQGINIPNIGEIGTEGHGGDTMGEMRPVPGGSPEELVEHIKVLIETMHKHMPLLTMTTLSIGRPSGGHLHLDVPAGLASNEKVKSRLIRLAATFLMPIFASEHRMCSASRYTQGQYGHANDVRFDHKGPNRDKYCIELRALTSEWICTPKIALSTLSYMSVVWNECIKNHEKLIKSDVVFKSQPQIEAVQKMILADYRPVGNSLIAEIGKMVRGFELYEQFKEECELILDPKAAFEEKEAAGWELFKGWGLRDKPKAITKRALMADKSIKARVKTINADLLNTTLSMPYNNDYNVEMYAKALAERTAALQWTLKYEYFLYGLKKGIEGFTIAPVNSDAFFAIPKNATAQDITHGANKMKERFNSVRSLANGTRIDPKSGKTRKGCVDAIVIGIPYDVRVDKNVKPLIEQIWKIERGTLTAKPTKDIEFPTIETLAANSKKDLGPGEIETTAEFERGLSPVPPTGMPTMETVSKQKVWERGQSVGKINNVIAEPEDDVTTSPF